MIIVFSINNLGMHILSSFFEIDIIQQFFLIQTHSSYRDRLYMQLHQVLIDVSMLERQRILLLIRNQLLVCCQIKLVYITNILYGNYGIYGIISQLLINISIIVTYQFQVNLIHEYLNLFKCIETIQALIILVILEIIK